MEENKNIRIKTEQQNNELNQNGGIIIYAESKEPEIVNAVSGITRDIRRIDYGTVERI